MEIVIASSNTQKVSEIREILKDLAPLCSILSLFDFPDFKPLATDPSKTIAQNALAKAQHAASALKKCSIAEHWGLILPTLGDKAKSLFSHDTTTAQTKDILKTLAGKSDLERSAYIESTIACVTADGKERIATGRIEGFIADSERGKGSNDFNSIFIKHDYMKTLAELSNHVRLRVSPRRKALEKLIGFFETAR
ncbi:MAG: hypothetical protein LLF94_06245 [Chlamydiales bacterium]|nr:hypothetical protein [Chlamydiales bacterium]